MRGARSEDARLRRLVGTWGLVVVGVVDPIMSLTFASQD